MATILHDLFNDTGGTLLSAHTPDIGGAYSQYAPHSTTTLRIGTGGTALEPSTNAIGVYTNAATPAAANYEATFGLIQHTNNNTNFSGIVMRFNTSTGVHYHVRYSQLNGAWQLYRHDGTSYVSLGSFTQALTLGQEYLVRFKLYGDRLRINIDDVERIVVTDSNISAAGLSGLRMVGTASDTVGIQITKFTVKDFSGGVTRVGLAVDAESSGPNLQMNGPTVPDGSLMFAFCSTFHGGRTITATGWTPVTGPETYGSLTLLTKIAAGEPQAYQFNLAGGNSPTSVAIVAYEDFDPTTPYTTPVIKTGNSTTPNNDSQSVENDGSMLIQYVGTGGNRTITPEDGQTELYDAIESFGGTGPTLGVLEKPVNSGETALQSVTVVSGGITWNAGMFVIRAIPAGGGGTSVNIPLGLLAAASFLPTPSGLPAIPLGLLAESAFLPSLAGSLDIPLGQLTESSFVPGGDGAAGVPLGLLTVAGSLPSFATAIPLGSYTVSPFATAPESDETPPLGTITLTGIPPEGSGSPSVPLGVITLTGFAPDIDLDDGGVSIFVPLGVLNFFGLIPSGSASAGIPLGTTAVTGNTPDLGASLGIPLAALSVSPLTPSSMALPSVPLGSLQLNGLTASPTLQALIDLGVITFDGIEPQLILGQLFGIFAGGEGFTYPAFNSGIVSTYAAFNSGIPYLNLGGSMATDELIYTGESFGFGIPEVTLKKNGEITNIVTLADVDSFTFTVVGQGITGNMFPHPTVPGAWEGEIDSGIPVSGRHVIRAVATKGTSEGVWEIFRWIHPRS